MKYIKLLADELVTKHETYDPEKLIKSEGIELVFHTMDINGLYISNCGRKTIVIDSKLYGLEKITAMYHELAHSQMHPDETYLLMKDYFIFESSKIENEANTFAAYMVLKYSENIDFEPGDEELLEKLKTFL